MGKGGGGQNTTVTKSDPPPEVMAQYRQLIAQANKASAAPLQQYQGPIVAGFTPDQTSAFNTIDQSQGLSKPYTDQANGLINQSTRSLWDGVQKYSPDALRQYENPYQQDVIKATQDQMNNQDQMQQQGVIGNAISSGAWGGDRSAVAQAQLAGQQALANKSTLANLNAQNFGQATQQFNQQQQTQLGANAQQAGLASQGAFGMMNLGNQVQNNALQGANAQLQSGALQQQLGQENLNVPYEQFQQTQAYPFQNLSWLSGISTGLGAGSGGTSSTTAPSPSLGAQLGGLGMAGLGAYGSLTGGKARGGKIESFAFGGAPYSDMPGMMSNNGVPDISRSYIPNAPSLSKGLGMPSMMQSNGSKSTTSAPDRPVTASDLAADYNMGKGARSLYNALPDAKSTYFADQQGANTAAGMASSDVLPMGATATAPDGTFSIANGTGLGSSGATSLANPASGLANVGAADTTGSVLGASGVTDLSSLGAANLAADTGAVLDTSALSAGAGAAATDAAAMAATAETAAAADAAGMTVAEYLAMFALKRGGKVQKFADGGAPLDYMQAMYGIPGLNPMMPALVKQESGGNPNAVSPVGAGGLTQIMPATARDPGFGVKPLQGWDGVNPATAPVAEQMRFGNDYLNAMQAHNGGDPVKAAAAYNWGPGNLDSQGLANAPAETKQYVANVAGNGLAPAGPNDITTQTDITPLANKSVTAADADGNPIDTSAITNAAPINKPDPWLSLMKAGFATMAAKTPFAMQALGEGAGAGVEDYQAQKKEAAQESEKQGSLQAQAEQLYNTAKNTKDELALKRDQMEQGKVAATPAGQRYFTTGPKAGQLVPDQDMGGDAGKYADNIGIKLMPATTTALQKEAAKIIGDSATNLSAATDGIMSIKRIQQLLPTISQGKMAEGERYLQKIIGSPGVTPEQLAAAKDAAFPPGTDERAAYEEIQKLEGNAALQNEVANGIRGRALGFNMVKLGQGLFANPEMDKRAQASILDKSLFNMQMAKNANEVIQPFGNMSAQTINQAKQKYYNESVNKGYAIPTDDFLSGAYKASDYKQPAITPPPAVNAPVAATTGATSAPPLASRVAGQKYPTPKGPMTWTGTGWVP